VESRPARINPSSLVKGLFARELLAVQGFEPREEPHTPPTNANDEIKRASESGHFRPDPRPRIYLPEIRDSVNQGKYANQRKDVPPCSSMENAPSTML
jgi:hypothetical protein